MSFTDYLIIRGIMKAREQKSTSTPTPTPPVGAPKTEFEKILTPVPVQKPKDKEKKSPTALHGVQPTPAPRPKNKLTFLEVQFIFEPDAAWANIYDFERTMTKVFKSEGLQATEIDATRGFATGKKVIYVTRMTDILDDPSKGWREA